jgi:hypothetical protein
VRRADTPTQGEILAVNVNYEQARSELVIAPILVEFELLYRNRISLCELGAPRPLCLLNHDGDSRPFSVDGRTTERLAGCRR